MKEPTEWKLLKMSEKIEQLKYDIVQIQVKLMCLPEMKSQIENMHQEDYTKAIHKVQYEKAISDRLNELINEVQKSINNMESVMNKGFFNWIKRQFCKNRNKK